MKDDVSDSEKESEIVSSGSCYHLLVIQNHLTCQTCASYPVIKLVSGFGN